MRLPLPSMRVRVTLGAALLALFFVFLASQYTKQGFPFRVKAKEEVRSSAELAVAIAEQDQDQDGLKDWEETLWKTDSANPDTDRDGTLDGKEVNEGRDPAKKGPGDEISVKSGTETENNDLLSSTGNLSEVFIQNYITLKQEGGGEMTEQDRLGLVQNLSSQVTVVAEAKVYSESDLRLVPTDMDSLHKYGNELAQAISENSSADTGNEPSLVQNLMQTGSTVALQRLNKAAAQYRLMVSALYIMEVPTSVTTPHLTLLNAFSVVGASIQGMTEVQTDPLRALTALSSYESEASNITQAWNQVAQFMTQNGVTFTQQEYGFLFNGSI